MFGSLKKLFGGESREKKQILAPVSGRAIPMKEVADPTFSQEILGKGVAIVPTEGVIVAPASGEVAVMFETGHAVSIKTDFGAELIVHVGLDTVNLKGQYFKPHVSQGDKVKAGDVLVEVELDKVKEAGLLTMEDILEELVGNIFDEYDDVEVEYKKIDDNTYLVEGSVSLYELKKIIGIEIPEGDYETLSGYLIEKLGRFPEENEHPVLEDERLTYRIEEYEDKRIQWVKICRNQQEKIEDAEE